MAISVVIFVTFILLYCGYRWYKRYEIIRKINRIPGMPGSVSGLGIRSSIVLMRSFGSATNSGKICEKISQYMECNNKLFPGGIWKTYVGPEPIVILCNPEHVQSFISNSKNEIRKGYLYRFMTFMGNGLVTSHGDVWRNQRKLLTPAFHFKILEHAIPVMNKNSDILLNKLDEERMRNKDSIIDDISNFVLLCSLDVISESAMGQEMHAQEKSDSEFVKYNRTMSSSIMDRASKPWIHSDFMFDRSSLGQKFNQDVDGVLRLIDDVIDNKRQLDDQVNSRGEMTSRAASDESPPAFMDVLMNLHNELPDEVSLKDLRDQVLTFMAAGYETTGWTVTWAIHLLSLHPEVQQRLQEELDQEVESGKEITYEMAKTGLPLTEAVMKETMRLYPTIPIFSRQLEHDIVINGYDIPAATNVGINLLALHRHPDHWDQPDRFIPDRFLAPSGSNRHPFAFIPFSAGLRNCIGQRYAMIEGKLLIAKIFREFRITAADPNVHVQTRTTVVLAASERIRVKLEKRG